MLYDQSKLRQHLTDCLEKGTMAAFTKYKCNVKYKGTNISWPFSSEDQHKWLLARRSARLEKRLENTTPIEIEINKQTFNTNK